MGLPRQTVPLSPEEVADLSRKLADLRHNVNNHLALMVAALELIRRKPEMVERMVNNLTDENHSRLVASTRIFPCNLAPGAGVFSAVGNVSDALIGRKIAFRTEFGDRGWLG